MKKKAARKYANLLVGIILTALAASSTPLPKVQDECFASQGQTVVGWKDMYWFPCRYRWRGFCVWPIQRRHTTYKVTVHEGIPLRDKKGLPIPIASGKIRKWEVYDSASWNAIESQPIKKRRYPGYERIAENEYVVVVETRYRLFHNVEANLRICTQKP